MSDIDYSPDEAVTDPDFDVHEVAKAPASPKAKPKQRKPSRVLNAAMKLQLEKAYQAGAKTPAKLAEAVTIRFQDGSAVDAAKCDAWLKMMKKIEADRAAIPPCKLRELTTDEEKRVKGLAKVAEDCYSKMIKAKIKLGEKDVIHDFGIELNALCSRAMAVLQKLADAEEEEEKNDAKRKRLMTATEKEEAKKRSKIESVVNKQRKSQTVELKKRIGVFIRSMMDFYGSGLGEETLYDVDMQTLKTLMANVPPTSGSFKDASVKWNMTYTQATALLGKGRTEKKFRYTGGAQLSELTLRYFIDDETLNITVRYSRY